MVKFKGFICPLQKEQLNLRQFIKEREYMTFSISSSVVELGILHVVIKALGEKGCIHL